jgi:hypothetical protein
MDTGARRSHLRVKSKLHSNLAITTEAAVRKASDKVPLASGQESNEFYS